MNEYRPEVVKMSGDDFRRALRVVDEQTED